MNTITVRLPKDVATQLETEHINKKQLDSFLVAAVKVWLIRCQADENSQLKAVKRPWSEAFQGSAVTFVDQLINENQSLFEELAHL
ncbi:MAG: hypothetical protein QME81_07890 [bacterium]|nr:hypothetical protein [bacterium]